MLERARGRGRDAVGVYTALSRGRDLTTMSSYKRPKRFTQWQFVISDPDVQFSGLRSGAPEPWLHGEG